MMMPISSMTGIAMMIEMGTEKFNIWAPKSPNQASIYGVRISTGVPQAVSFVGSSATFSKPSRDCPSSYKLEQSAA